MSDLVEIGANLSSFLTFLSPQIKERSLQWYFSGSLAATIMGSAENITEIELDKENRLIGETKSEEITDEQREKLRMFSRKLGMDIDVVNVNGDLFMGAPSKNKPDIQNVIQHVPDVLDLMSWQPTMGGSMYIDNLEAERKITNHSVARVKIQKGDVYVTAPPEQLAHKLSETIWLSSRLSGEKVLEKQKSKYEKDIKDLSSMFYGFKDLYERQEFLDRIYLALNEKDGSLFSIHNPIYNSDNIMEGQEILDKHIMRRIIEDYANYLKTITDDKSDGAIRDFLNSLLDKRKVEVERFNRTQSANGGITPLKQRDNELSLLEAEEKKYRAEEALISQQREGQNMGD